VARFVLEKERERIYLIRVKYRLDDEEESILAPPPPSEPWKQKLAGLRPTTAQPDAAPARPQPPAELRYVEGQVIRVRVVGVLMGRQSEVGDSEMVDDTIPPELQDGLGWDSSFSYNGKDFATAHGYDPETRTLSLKLKRRMTLPVEGEILCEDVPTKTALDRQD
jgi:hypothetical protein